MLVGVGTEPNRAAGLRQAVDAILIASRVRARIVAPECLAALAS